MNKPVAWKTDGKEVMRLDNDDDTVHALGSLYRRDTDIITCWDKDSTEVIRIAPDGKVFWKQREVETDDDFRSAMLDLARVLKGNVIHPVKALTDEEMMKAEYEFLTWNRSLNNRLVEIAYELPVFQKVVAILRKAQEK